MADMESIRVEVAYTLPDRQTVIALTVPCDASVEYAIMRSNIIARHPEIDLRSSPVGIFGRLVLLSAQPAECDRIEIYRPLLAEPKQLRRARVREKGGQ